MLDTEIWHAFTITPPEAETPVWDAKPSADELEESLSAKRSPVRMNFNCKAAAAAAAAAGQRRFEPNVEPDAVRTSLGNVRGAFPAR